MTRVVIFRRSDRPEVGPAAHLPASADAAWPPGHPPTVARTLCGLVGIGRTFDRDDATCPLCVAMSGRHPGKRGKAWLRRQMETAR